MHSISVRDASSESAMATDSIVYWQILSSSVLYAFPHKSQSETSYTYKYIYIYFFCATFCGGEGSSRNHQRLEGYLLNKICTGVSSTSCFCSFSPLYLKDYLKQIGS